MACYFEYSYYTEYFDVCIPKSAQQYGGWWPSPKEWQSYLKRLNQATKHEVAERVAKKDDLRKILMEKIFPRKKYRKVIVRTADTRTEPLPKNVQPKYIVRQIRLPYIPDANAEIRRRLAADIREIRRIAREIRKKKRKLREEEALILILYG